MLETTEDSFSDLKSSKQKMTKMKSCLLNSSPQNNNNYQTKQKTNKQ